MKVIFLIFLLTSPALATIRVYNYQIQVTGVTTTYSNQATYAPPAPASIGDVLVGTLLLDDTTPDTDSSPLIGSYGNTFSGPQNKFTFLGTSYDGVTAGQQGLGVNIYDNTSVTLPFFGQTYAGDSLALTTAFQSGGIGGTADQRQLQFVLNRPDGTFVSSDALPTGFTNFDANFVGSLKFTQFQAERVAPSGNTESRNMTITGKFLSLTPVPESSGLLLVAGGGLVLATRRRRLT